MRPARPRPFPPLLRDRAQDARRARGRVVVGEDVVDLVAPATRRETAHVRPLAIAILELRLGLVGLVCVVRIVILGQTEVDERAMP